MPRPAHYDVDEARALWEAGETPDGKKIKNAKDLWEALDVPEEALRSVQAMVRRYYGRRPPAAARTYRDDWLKAAVINHQVSEYGLRRDYCGACQSYCGSHVYLRQLNHMDGQLNSVIVVGKCCKRAGDY